MVLSEVFLTGLYVAGFGFLGLVLGVCYKSKCSKVSCCGFEIVRDVAGEEQIDQIEIEHKPTETRRRSDSLP